MFVSFFPRPKLFFLSAIIWTALAMALWYGFAGNLVTSSSHRVGVDFDAAAGSPDAMLAAIESLGYSARPFDAAILDAADSDNTSRELVLAMAVAGFAAILVDRHRHAF